MERAHVLSAKLSIVAPEAGAGLAEIMEASREVLTTYADRRSGVNHPVDPGPAVLAALVLRIAESDLSAREAAEQALAGWVVNTSGQCSHPGLFVGGVAGCQLALRIASASQPGLARLAAAARRKLVRHCAAGIWRTAKVDWSDYDLVMGPAGILLGLAGDPDATLGDMALAASQLMALCARDDLDGIRGWQQYGTQLPEWTNRPLNTGVAHGVPGAALGLCAFADRWGLDEQLTTVLRRIADWLMSDAHTDPRGVITWFPAARERPAPVSSPNLRQAWCYGTPGVAWTLWELGRVIGDASVRDFARAAFSSFLAMGGVNHNNALRDGLALCHGDAGVLLVCDAFVRHAGLDEAGSHRDLLDARLRARLEECGEWAWSDRLLLSGPSGVLAALLTIRSGERAWLAALGLR
jgi:lantibiotic biosynthesis protein